MRVLVVLLAAALLVALAAAPAAAQRKRPPPTAPRTDAERADALFREGRAHLEAKDYAAACERFEESQKLDPGIGTLLNLGLCYEGMGKLVSAAERFAAAERQANAQGDTKRAAAAGAKVRALADRVPHLTITASAPAPGLTVTVGGEPLPADQLGQRRALDPGRVEVEATAPDREPYRVTVDLVDGDDRKVEIPPLVDPSAQVDAAIRAPAAPAASGRGRRLLGLGVTGAGGAALAASLALALSAKSTYDSAFDDKLCSRDMDMLTCNPEGQRRTEAARRRGTIATVVGGAGLAAVAVGVTVWLTAPADERPRQARVVPVIGPDGAGLAVAGSF